MQPGEERHVQVTVRLEGDGSDMRATAELTTVKAERDPANNVAVAVVSFHVDLGI